MTHWVTWSPKMQGSNYYHQYNVTGPLGGPWWNQIKSQEVPFFGTPCLLEKYFLERYACFRNVHCRCLSGCHKWWVSTCPKPHFTNLMGMVLAMPKDCLFHRHNLGNSHLDKIHRWPSLSKVWFCCEACEKPYKALLVASPGGERSSAAATTAIYI